MATHELVGIVLAVLAVIAAYTFGYRAGHAAGRDDGYDEGKRQGAKEGSMRGYAVGYDRGRRGSGGESSAEEESSPTRGFGVVGIVLAVVVFLALAVTANLRGRAPADSGAPTDFSTSKFRAWEGESAPVTPINVPPSRG